MWKRMRKAAQSVVCAVAAAVLVSATAAWAVDPPEGGEGPEIRSERVEKAKGAEQRAHAEKEEHFDPRTARIDDLNPDWDDWPRKAIHSVLSSQQAAWNRGDIDAFMDGYWKSDDLRFASGGTVTKGWQATLDRYRERYENREKMGTLSFSGLDVNVLGEDAALVFGRWKLERKEDAPAGLFTLLFRKIGDNWVIVHDHTSLE
jgi:ketosteroid isomerase-like protein